MKWSRIYTSLKFKLLMVIRRRIVILLLAVVPVVFLGVVAWTTSERILPFLLASLDEETYIRISERAISFVFFAVASAGFLVAFFSLDLVRRNRKADKRLIICGYHPLEVLLADIFAILIVTMAISVYIAILTHFFHSIDHILLFMVGLSMIGFVYGCYGLLAGLLVKGELEGILMIVLLVNIDAGWLQNPLFYADAQSKIMIRILPAYYPSQASIIAALTDYSMSEACIKSIAYGLAMLVLSMIIFYQGMRLKR